jgi:hypothetical protein
LARRDQGRACMGEAEVSYLCHDCTCDFVAETFAEGHGLGGVTYEEPSISQASECDRCGKVLPESPELEAASNALLIRTVAVLRDRGHRSIRILEGNA